MDGTDAFLGQIAQEASRNGGAYSGQYPPPPGGGGRYEERSSGGHYDGRRRREDDDGGDRKRRHYDDRDDRYGGRRDDRDRSSHRSGDPYGHHDRYPSSSRRDGGGYERRDPYGGRAPPPQRGGYDDRRYSSRGYPEDAYRRGGGGSGGGRKDWRSDDREASPLVRRSPTPENVVPISQHPRRANLWDIKPPGFESYSTADAKASGIFGVPGQMRMLDTGALIGMNAGPNGTAAAFGGGAGTAGAAAASVVSQIGPGGSSMNRQARRLYVGNIGWDATEQLVCGFFNNKLRELGLVNQNLPGPDPCIATQINAEKGYAFVEFRSPEEATNAMAFDGIVFQSQSLKIRRPKDYVGPDVAAPSHVHVPGVVSTNVPDGPNKIFIGGLPTYLNDEQVMELLKAFGELRAFNLVREQGNGPSKGFAFCEYVDTNITDLACQGLNDMELGDRRLVVQRASLGSGKGNAGGQTMGGPMMQPGALSLPPSFISGGAGQDAGEPTRCMQMLNMVTLEDLTDDTEYSEIVEDIREECAKFGQVMDVRIPRPEKESKSKAAQNWKAAEDASATAAAAAAAGVDNGEPQNGTAQEDNKPTEREGVGRVYVKFAEKEQCAAALKSIAGRQFGGRVVIAAFLAEDQWPGDEDGGENSDETAKMATGPKAE